MQRGVRKKRKKREKRRRSRRERVTSPCVSLLSIFMCRRYRARAASEFNLLFRIVCLAVNRVLFESALKGSLNHHGHFRLLPANFAELLSAEFPQILKLAAVPDARRILPSTERARPTPCNHRRKDEARVKRGWNEAFVPRCDLVRSFVPSRTCKVTSFTFWNRNRMLSKRQDVV